MGTKDVETPVGIGILLSTYTTLTYNWRHAIGELVDNCIDSYLEHEDELKDGIDIYIDYDSSAKTLQISDTAYGMDFDDMNKAVQITRQNGHEYYERGIGRYGLGMKKAATFLGPKWKLISKCKNSKQKYTVVVDVEKLAKTNAKKLTITNSSSNSKHGTRLEIQLAKVMKGTAEQTCINHLCEMYKHFMEKGVVRIRWNDDLLSYNSPKIRETTKAGVKELWSTDIEFEVKPEDGGVYKVTGKMYILQTMSNTLPGVQLFHSDRMIIGGSGSPNENWRPKALVGNLEGYVARRFCAELNVNDLTPNHQKDGFVWSKFTRDELIDSMKKLKIVKDYLKESKMKVEKGPGEAPEETRLEEVIKNIENRINSPEVTAAIAEQKATKNVPVKKLSLQEVNTIVEEEGVDVKTGTEPSLSVSHFDSTYGPFMTTYIAKQTAGVDQITVLVNKTFDYVNYAIHGERETEIWHEIIQAFALTEYTLQDLEKIDFPKMIEIFGDFLNSFRESGN